MSVANLEISLFSRAAGAYGIKLRYAAAGSEKEKIGGGSTPLTADDPEFLARGLDPASYGQYLASQLLADTAVSDFFREALAVAQGQDARLHIRLGIDRDAARLHDLRWETLRLPGAAAPLLTGANLTFSRYLDSLDFRPVNPRSASDIRALVVVADPSDVAQFSLAPVNQAEELDRARTALGDIPSVELATRGQATLNNIVRSLRDGCDILFLVAHGVLARGEPWLFLEKEDGTADRVSGRDLVTRIGELEDRPRLAVLASCQSAGTGQPSPLPRTAALWPAWARAWPKPASLR